MVSPIGNSLTKLNTGAQLQTFPYPTVSKSFLYSNAFMAKSGAQSLTDEGQIWCAIADPCLLATFRLNQFILSPSVGQKPHFLPFFRLRHLVLSPIGKSLTKLNTGAQLQTFPYPTVSKAFLYSNAFMAKSGAQDVQKRDRQKRDGQKRDGQTNKQKQTKKLNFWPSRRRVKSEPHQTWHGDRGPRARSCTSKTFGV